jgi:geranylgeranyl pyrophosphate synthase
MRNSECNSRLLNSEIKTVRRLINQTLVSLLPACNQLIRYYQANRGKMIRPKLLLLSGGACRKITEDHIHSAAIFQIIHDATLLHDDVIDNGLLRRNAATINSSWGNKVAVLTGDLFLGHAIKMCLGLNRKAVSVIIEAIIKTCEGEISQDFRELYDNITEHEYISLIQMKSAEMFSQCCYLGGLLSGADNEICNHLKTYGLLIGTAYQISDDIEDICCNDAQLGKSSRRDMQSRILTLPVIYYIQQGGNWSQLNKMTQNEIIEQLEKSSSFEYCRERIEELCLEAIEHLACLTKSKYKYALKDIAELISSQSEVGQSNYI